MTRDTLSTSSSLAGSKWRRLLSDLNAWLALLLLTGGGCIWALAGPRKRQNFRERSPGAPTGVVSKERAADWVSLETSPRACYSLNLWIPCLDGFEVKPKGRTKHFCDQQMFVFGGAVTWANFKRLQTLNQILRFCLYQPRLVAQGYLAVLLKQPLVLKPYGCGGQSRFG